MHHQSAVLALGTGEDGLHGDMCPMHNMPAQANGSQLAMQTNVLLLPTRRKTHDVEGMNSESSSIGPPM